jgi:pyrimidine-nucleoside phosphorylase
MDFLPADLIRKKRFGESHSREEIRFLIQNYSRGAIPDYQMSAWLMAVCFRGMNEEETAALTQEMRDSGVVMDLSHLGTPVDKHSTGGVGDKTSLILTPIVAAAGVPVPMIAGRGLGHTGGTLDKLEAIAGFSVRLTREQFQSQVARVGAAIMGQTEDICPADRKLYALRDVTGTVDSLPLICGSIMSKKLAEGMQGLVLDVKYGSGAFMKSLDDSRALARALMSIGKNSGKAVVAVLSRMTEPLGRFVGNALEVQECLDILDGKSWHGSGKGYEDTLELSLALAAHMIVLGKKARDLPTARARAEELLASGRARLKFNELCSAQGGKIDKGLPRAKLKHRVLATSDGFINYTDVDQIGMAAIWLGAGRRLQSDTLDLAAGIEVCLKQGDVVRKGDPLFILHAASPERIDSSLLPLQNGFTITTSRVAPAPLIAETLPAEH